MKARFMLTRPGGEVAGVETHVVIDTFTVYGEAGLLAAIEERKPTIAAMRAVLVPTNDDALELVLGLSVANLRERKQQDVLKAAIEGEWH